MARTRQAARRLRRFAEVVAAMLLATMFLAFIVQIAFRYLFDFPIGWTSELTVITWLWLSGAVFAVAVLVRYAWILWWALRGRGPEAFDPTKASSGV